MLSMSDKHDAVNEHTQEICKSMKLHTLGVWQNAHKFIRQLAREMKCGIVNGQLIGLVIERTQVSVLANTPVNS